MAPDFRGVFTFNRQKIKRKKENISKVSTWHNSTEFNHIYGELQTVADNEDADYDDQDCADNEVPPLPLTQTIKSFWPRPEDGVSESTKRQCS